MRQLETMVEVTALAIQERIARIHDALHGLHDLTLSSCTTTERNPRAVAQWLEAQGFGLDDHGYFERLDILSAVRAGNLDADTHVYYATATVRDDPEGLHCMYCLRNISDVLSGLHSRLPYLERIYYQDARRFSLAYPLHDPTATVPADFDWRSHHTFASVLAKVNPAREIRWAAPAAERPEGRMISSSIPLYHEDTMIGVWSFDIPIASLLEHSGHDLFILDRDGKPLSALGPDHEDVDLGLVGTNGRTTLIDKEGKSRRVITRTIPNLGWTLVASIPEEALMARLSRSFTKAFERVRQGDLDHRMLPIGDELQGIVDAYNDMVGELQNTNEVNEEALRELENSRQTTRAVFDGAPMGLVLIRPDRSIIDINAEFARLVDLPAGSVLRRDLASLGAEEIGPRLAADLDAPQSRAGERPVETELRRGDGSLVPVRIVLRKLDLDGVPFLLAGVEDLTLRRSLQARLQHTQQIQAIGKLAAGVAHDFNNLLTSVVGNACFLQESVEDEELREMADAILVAARTGSALTSQLLAISRREIVQPRAVAFPEVLRESETLLRRLLDEDVALEFEIDDVLPAVWADPSQLLQVVMNLVINARDALGREGKTIRVCLGQSPDTPESLRLSVTDDGVGIAEGLRGRVFEAFYTTKSRGTGLGLSTVRDIVDELGGRVSFESVLGRGTTFRVELPFLESAVPTVVESRPTSPLPDERVVVVVDDEPAVREITVRMLERAGFVARGCEDGVAALVALEALGSRVGLVLTDVVMPGMSGRELADTVLSLRPELPVLFMSGYTEDAVLLRGVEASKVGLLRKPFRPKVLVEAVRELLAKA